MSEAAKHVNLDYAFFLEYPLRYNGLLVIEGDSHGSAAGLLAAKVDR